MLAETYESSPELQHALNNPLVVHEAKRAILRDLATRLAVSDVAKHALLLLGDRRRLHVLPGIAHILRQMSDARQGVVRAEVVTAVRLSEGYFARLQAALEQLTGRKVALDRSQDPAILAGVIVRIGDRVYDG